MFFCHMKSCRCSQYFFTLDWKILKIFLYPWLKLKCTLPWNSHYMFAMCKHLALICLCSRWLVGDLWPSQVTPSPEWNMLCTNPIEYNPKRFQKKKTSVYLSFIIKIRGVTIHRCIGESYRNCQRYANRIVSGWIDSHDISSGGRNQAIKCP